MLFVPPSFLDNFLLKNPMNLTDEQWCLIEPILPPPSPSDRGRPPLRYPPGMLRCAPQSQTVGLLSYRNTCSIVVYFG